MNNYKTNICTEYTPVYQKSSYASCKNDQCFHSLIKTRINKTLKFSFFLFFLSVCINSDLFAQTKSPKRKLVYAIRAALVQDCIGTTNQTFPYIPNFGTSTSPSSEKDHWSQQSSVGTITWDYQAIPGESNTLVPYNPEVGLDHLQGKPGLYSRCLSLKSTEKYQVSFAVVTPKAGSTNKLKIWLSPQTQNGFEFTDNLSSNALIKELSNIPSGTSIYENVIIEGSHIPTDGIYAVVIEFLSDMGQGPLYIKNYKIEKIPGADHALGNLVSPLSSCNLSDTETVKIRFKNKGNRAVNTITAYYQIDGNTPIKQDFILNNLASQKETILSFSTKANFSNKKTYTLKAWLAKDLDDDNTTNDTLHSLNLSSTNISYTPPFTNTFNSNTERDGWNILAKDFDKTATWAFKDYQGGQYAEIETDNVDTISDWLISPCINLTAGKTYSIHFWYKALSSLGEHLQLNLSTDPTQPEAGIALWNREGFTSTLGGTPNSEGYMEAITYITPSQTSKYYIGFKAFSPGSKKGIAIDNLKMTEVSPATIPFSQGFESETAKQEVSTVDANLDNFIWEIHSNPNYAYNSLKYAEIKGSVDSDGKDGGVGNDWLLLNPLKLEANKKYVLSYTVSGTTKDFYKVLIGNSYNHKILDTLSTMVWEDTPTNEYTQKTHSFTPSTTGVYYVAFHYYGAPNKNTIFRLDNIIVTDSLMAKDTSMALIAIKLPLNASAGITEEKLSLNYRNLGNYILKAADVHFHYQLNGGTIYSKTPSSDIKPGEYGSIEFIDDKIDFRSGSSFHIKAWLSCKGDRKHDDDTLQTTIIVPLPLQIPIKVNFESGENLDIWSIVQSDPASDISWKIDSLNTPEKAYKGQGSLYAPSSSKTSAEYFISQSIQLSKDTTYCVRFYYAVGSQGNINGPSLTLLYNFNKGKDKNSFFVQDSIIDMKNFLNTTYQRKLKYFRVSQSGKYYFAFKDYSSAGAKDFRIDNFLITDSLSTTRSDVQITHLIPPPNQICDLGSAEKISIKIRNNSVFDIQDIPVNIQFGSKSQVITEIIDLNLESEESYTYTLKTPWDFSGIDKDSVRVWLSLPSDINPSDDTTDFYVIERQQSQTPPFNSGFEANEPFTWTVYDANEDGCTWNLSSGSLPHKGSASASYTGDGSVLACDWLLSPCIDLNPDSLYLLEFYHKANPGARERIEIYLLNSLRPDSLKAQMNPLFKLDSLVEFNYTAFKDSLRVAKRGNYHLAFKIYSDYAGQRLQLDDIRLEVFPPSSVDTNYDIALLSISAPLSSGLFNSAETLSVVLKNASKYTAKKIALRCELDTKILFTDTISKMNAGEELAYTFQKRLNLYTPGNYTLKVTAILPKDTNTNNNSKELSLISYQQDVGIEALTAPTKLPPFTSAETIKLKLKNYGQYPLDPFPITLIMNSVHFTATVPSIAIGQSIDYTFPKPMNMLLNKDYNFIIYTSAPKDLSPTNDTLRKLFPKRVGFEDPSTAQDPNTLTIYPNPTNTYLHIQSQQTIETIDLIQTNGQIKQQLKPKNKTVILDVQNYPKGNYLIQITFPSGQTISRIVVVI